jgi:hypothetical protein
VDGVRAVAQNFIDAFTWLRWEYIKRIYTVKRKKKKSATKHFTHARITHLKKTYTTTEKGTLAFFFVPRVRVSRLSRKMETASGNFFDALCSARLCQIDLIL